MKQKKELSFLIDLTLIFFVKIWVIFRRTRGACVKKMKKIEIFLDSELKLLYI